MNIDIRKKIVQARINLLVTQPFFGTLALRLRLVEDESCETFWTDGVSLGYNPDYAAHLSKFELQGVVCHEVLHCANLHPYRQAGREHRRWNHACDYAINPMVRAAGMRLPKGALLEQQYVGLPAEAIYAKLPVMPQDGSGPQSGNGCGEVRPSPSPSDASAQEQDWKVAVEEAAAQARKQGKLPAGVRQMVDELRRPRIDWIAETRRFVQEN